MVDACLILTDCLVMVKFTILGFVVLLTFGEVIGWFVLWCGIVSDFMLLLRCVVIV